MLYDFRIYSYQIKYKEILIIKKEAGKEQQNNFNNKKITRKPQAIITN